MSASGLVYAAIVLMWGAVLIPMWLRRHDVASENRSAERFGQAMRVLSRREGSDARRETMVPTSSRRTGATTAPTSSLGSSPVSSRPVTTPAVTSPPGAPPRRTPVRARSPRREARADLARRRARTLLALGLLAVALGVLAVVAVVPVWAPVLAGMLLAGFVVNLRVQAKRSTQRRRRGVAPVPAPRADAHAERSAAVPAPAAERAATSRALVVEGKGRPQSAAAAVTGAEPVAPATGAADDPIWQPNPMPLPTYVTAPKAVRPIRVIDLTTPGAWTSGRLLEDEVPVVEDTLAAADADAQALDALLEHDVAVDEAGSRSQAPRRAVND